MHSFLTSTEIPFLLSLVLAFGNYLNGNSDGVSKDVKWRRDKVHSQKPAFFVDVDVSNAIFYVISMFHHGLSCGLISFHCCKLRGEVTGRLYLVLGTPGGSWPTVAMTVSTLDDHYVD